MYRFALALILVSAIWIVMSEAFFSAGGEASPARMQEGWRYFAIAEPSTGKLIGIVGGDYAPAGRPGNPGVPVPGIAAKENEGYFEVTGNPDLGKVMADVDAYRVDSGTKSFKPNPQASTSDTGTSLPLLQLIPGGVGILLAGTGFLRRKDHWRSLASHSDRPHDPLV